MVSVTSFKGHKITRQQVIQALEEFDFTYPASNDFENWLESGNYHYALDYEGKLYPPKYILSVVSGESVETFSGGEQTHRVFANLGFKIVNKL